MTQQTEDDRARGAAAAMGVAQKHRKSERGREKEKRGEENMEEDARALLEAGSLRTDSRAVIRLKATSGQ
ncbi:hypothetical protein LTR28_013440 [Elasticomyces elasticus]|nr:hypothetical protein LTR28_013440 [Elasticomyces elasticus]